MAHPNEAVIRPMHDAINGGDSEAVASEFCVFHLRDGRIVEAWFSGDPQVQDAFWG